MLEQEYRSLQRLMEIAELRKKGIQDAHLLDWNFRVAEDTPYVQMGKRYVNNWKQVKAENLGLLFWGDVGTGKSFLAACIANGLLDQGVSVMMTNFTRILNKLSDLQAKERCQYIAAFGKVDLLIIDDLGVERNSEFALEQVYAVIDERYKANLPLIITTNLTPRQMRSVQDVATPGFTAGFWRCAPPFCFREQTGAKPSAMRNGFLQSRSCSPKRRC